MQTLISSNGSKLQGPEAHMRDLLAALASLHELLKKLLDLSGRKLAAMRAADAEKLQQCTAEEHDVLEALLEGENRRDAVLARLAQTLHWPDARKVRLVEMSQRLPEPFRSQMLAKTAGLRETARALKEKNRLAASVARHLHAHMRAVFDDVARVNQESIVYGPDGKHEQRKTRSWVDAVG